MSTQPPLASSPQAAAALKPLLGMLPTPSTAAIDEDYPTSVLYKRLLGYLKPYWPRALTAMLITLPIGGLDAAIAFSLKPYVDVIHAKNSMAQISFVPLIIVGFTMVQGLLNYLSTYLNGWVGFRLMSDLRADLFKKLQTMDVFYFDALTSGRILQQYFRDPESIQTNVLNNTRQMLTRLSSSVALMGVLLYQSWKLAIIAIGILLLVLVPSVLIRKRIKSLYTQSTLSTGNMMSFYTESLAGIKTIYGFNYEPTWIEKFNDTQKTLFTKMIKFVQAQGWLTPSMHIIASIGVGLIIWLGSAMVVSNELPMSNFVSFIVSMLMLYNPIKNLGGSMMNAQMSLFAAGRIFKLLDTEPFVKNAPDAQPFLGLKHHITFDHVRFTYHPDKPWVLNEICFEIPQGKVTALVGYSGSGKSTIANMLPRFYDALGGAILFDGVDIRNFELASLRSQIALVTQDNFLFAGTIRENLLVGNPKATESEMLQALRQAYLIELIDELPDGLDTEIGERGMMLSGGQRQRLAIARAFLKNSPIVILDEATSALDNKSEAMVQQAMDALMQHRTVIVIAHRLSTIQNADQIIVIDAGQVVETGTHTELLARSGLYSGLYNALGALEKEAQEQESQEALAQQTLQTRPQAQCSPVV